MLKAGESLFRDPVPLDYDFIPKLVPYREREQQQVAMCIRPLLQDRNGRNIIVYGPPGVGKTVAIRHLLGELEEETDEVVPLYINCWQKNTGYKICLEICDLIGYPLTHNKKTEELFHVIQTKLNNRGVVLVLDEVDKLEDEDFLYTFLEGLYRKSLILITNHKDWIADIDPRVKSRLTAETLQFKPYNEEEAMGILKERVTYAFVPGVWDDDALDFACEQSYKLGDIRTGLYLLKEAGNVAEDRASKTISIDDVKKAMEKFDEFNIKKKEDLEDETRTILELIRNNSPSRIGELYKMYQKSGGQGVYKTFQRKVRKLADNKFISTKKVTGGTEGTTTIVEYTGATTLRDFE